MLSTTIERCLNCAWERKYDLEMIPHEYQPWEDGTLVCTICGRKKEKIVPEPGHVHQWGKMVTLLAVSETSWGSYRYYCTGCSAYKLVNVAPGSNLETGVFTGGSINIYDE